MEGKQWIAHDAQPRTTPRTPHAIHLHICILLTTPALNAVHRVFSQDALEGPFVIKFHAN
jgi:hypothetical protein